MNATGQMVVSQPLAQWDTLLTGKQALMLREAGAESLHVIAGLVEVPEFSSGPLGPGAYLYSVEGPRISAVARLMMRLEKTDGSEQALLVRLADFPESAVAAVIGFFPVPHARVSRDGWTLMGFRGFLTQAEDPSLFAGVFYETVLDFHGDTCVFLPTATPRHYEQGDLTEIGVDGAMSAPIWGYGREGFRLTEV